MDYPQQRRTPRFLWSASAEITCGDTLELARVTELSRYGCYLETKTILSPGARVNLKIVGQGQIFEASATVLYSHATRGMGVAFRVVKSSFQSILEEWLRESLERQDKRPSIGKLEPDN
jgi:hypothetical protein